mmetsp:Transcript_28152/g.80935  ORF Transcript_28152/g.80935 Transcript_28152/m.80935 type:complete len:198 (+) Transcript_28152:27-620(+)
MRARRAVLSVVMVCASGWCMISAVGVSKAGTATGGEETVAAFRWREGLGHQQRSPPDRTATRDGCRCASAASPRLGGALRRCRGGIDRPRSDGLERRFRAEALRQLQRPGGAWCAGHRGAIAVGICTEVAERGRVGMADGRGRGGPGVGGGSPGHATLIRPPARRGDAIVAMRGFKATGERGHGGQGTSDLPVEKGR